MIGCKEPSKQAHRERSGSHHPTSHASLGRLYPPQGARAVMPKCVQALPSATLGGTSTAIPFGRGGDKLLRGGDGSVAVHIRKLSGEEAERAFPRRSQMDLTEYVNALRQLSPGDAAELRLNGLSSRAAKRRLGQAATQVGIRLKWSRTAAGNRLFFQVQSGKGVAGPANGRRRGRQTSTAAKQAPTKALSRRAGAAEPARPARRRRGQ